MDYAQKRAVMERLLPTCCEAFAFEALKASGWTLRDDILKPLHTAIKADWRGLKEEELNFMSAEVANTVSSVMKGEGDTPRTLVMAACMFALKLVDEGLTKDPMHQSVLIALAIMDEARNDETGEWGYDRAKIEEAGGRILSRAQLLGLYHQRVNATVP